MIYIFCAMRSEAQPIIDKYSLKLEGDLFVGESITVIITGMGKVNMAYAVGKISAQIRSEDRLLNIGVCAGKSFGIYEVVKVTDFDARRDFYPDIILESNLNKASLITVSRVINDGDISDALYDMEGSAFVESCLNFAGPHQLGLLKIVSDDGHGAEVTNEVVKTLMTSYLTTISKYIDINQSAKYIEPVSVDVAQLSEDLKCTEYMYQELIGLVKYSKLADIDYSGFLKEYYEEGKLPAVSKREGKEILDALRNYIIG